MPGSTWTARSMMTQSWKEQARETPLPEALDGPADHLAGRSRFELVGAGLYLLWFDVDFGAGGHDVVPFVSRAVVQRRQGARPGSTRLGARTHRSTTCFVALVIL